MEKMQPHASINPDLITRFHTVLTGYIKTIVISLTLGLLVSAAIITALDHLIPQTTSLWGITIGSVTSIFIFAVLIILSLLCYWIASPSREGKLWRRLKQHLQKSVNDQGD
jgi:hypothetical protein